MQNLEKFGWFHTYPMNLQLAKKPSLIDQISAGITLHLDGQLEE